MAISKKTEVWLRGPVDGIPPLVQPVAHALLQAREEIEALMQDFPIDKLWEKPAGVASVGFHLQHLTGVLDRLFTYAKGLALNDEQLHYLTLEGKPDEGLSVDNLVSQFGQQVDLSLGELSKINQEELTAVRGVGRANVPSTMLGLLVHAAEHTMRHMGQLYVTVKILKANLVQQSIVKAE